MPYNFIIILFGILLGTVAVLVTARLIHRGIKRFIRRTGLDLMARALNEPADMTTPRTLQNLTNTYSQLIARDFPEFDVRQFLSRAENLLVHILNSIESGEGIGHSEHKDVSSNLVNKVDNLIEDIRSKGEKWHYDDIYVHGSAIADYGYSMGKRTIKVEIALQYKFSNTSNDEGSRNGTLAQYKYSLDAIYIQDADKLGDKTFKGHNCPNCGAPVKSVGEGNYCQYCGSGLMEVNVRIWTFDNFTRC